jgi:hypothetical protein
MSQFTVTTNDLKLLATQLGRNEKHVEQAIRRAMKSFLAMIRKAVTTAVRAKVGLSEAEMKKVRIKGSSTSRGLKVELWVGENAIAARYLNPSLKSGGIQAGGQNFPRAFFPKRKSGGTLILQRVGSSRLPVAVPNVSILDVVEGVIDKQWGKFQSHFDEVVSAELSNLDAQ